MTADDLSYLFILFLYGILPWLLIPSALFLFSRAFLKKSWKLMLASFTVFLPDTLALLFLDLEPILKAFFILPILQVLYIATYFFKKK